MFEEKLSMLLYGEARFLIAWKAQQNLKHKRRNMEEYGKCDAISHDTVEGKL